MGEAERSPVGPTTSPSGTKPGTARPAHWTARDAILYSVLGGVSLIVPIALLAHITALAVVLPTVLGLWAVGFPMLVFAARVREPRTLGAVLALVGLALAVLSIGTGWFNWLTDEPYMMPHFLDPLLRGQDPYSTAITVTYRQYGTGFTDTATYSYLPLLLVLQPFVVSYKFFTVAAWATTAFLVRRRPWALVAIGQPYLALLAASGFNDFPVVLLLTLGLVGVAGRRQLWAEVLSLGAKQFANVVVVAYYLAKREVVRALVAVGISVAFVVPFLLWDPSSLVCRAVIVWPPVCGASSGPPFSHFNYWIYPVWVVGVFFEPLRERARRLLRSAARGEADVARGAPTDRPRTP